jgi:hypothetical protein
MESAEIVSAEDVALMVFHYRDKQDAGLDNDALGRATEEIAVFADNIAAATEAKVREEYAGLVERQRKYLRAAENLLTGISIHNERVVRDENSRYYISGPVVDDFKDEFRKLKAALEGKVSQ